MSSWKKKKKIACQLFNFYKPKTESLSQGPWTHCHSALVNALLLFLLSSAPPDSKMTEGSFNLLLDLSLSLRLLVSVPA